MRVLLISHDFLPAHPSGTEIYTAQLSRRLRERGLEVQLFTTEKDISAKHLSLREREYEGMRVHELVNNLFYDEFVETYDWDAPLEAFRRVLDEFQPDVIHVMHLLYLSIGCVEEANRRGIPVLYTLHDFWLQCARFGQRIHHDGSICHSIDFDRCGTCLVQLKFSQTRLERRMARLVAGFKGLTGIGLERPVRSLAKLLSRPGQGSGAPAVDPQAAQHMAEAARLREEAILGRLVPGVQRFFAPSAFLRERFVEWGIPAAKIWHVPNGIEPQPARALHPTTAPRPGLRVAFLGTLAPHKAPHLLLEAWERIGAERRARASLTLYGPLQHFPEYVGSMLAAAKRLGVELPGGLDREEVPRLWPEVDLLVIPSVWYENAPLTILEARSAGVAVLVSDLGGMAEMVQEGKTGWRFPTGDAGALAQRLVELIDDPSQLERLELEPEGVKTMQACTSEMLEHYAALCGGRP